jgi:hypothetical protein
LTFGAFDRTSAAMRVATWLRMMETGTLARPACSMAVRTQSPLQVNIGAVGLRSAPFM